VAYSLPPLNALRAFEAAARHLSFTRAADELCVTQGAISRHVAILEDHLRTKLFDRSSRGVTLTKFAEDYLLMVGEAFQTIDLATRGVSQKTSAEPMRVAGFPTFVSRWLLPRLPHLNEIHPDIMIRLQSGIELVNFDRESVDISIEGAPSSNANVISDKLLDVELVPVCSPTLVNGLPLPTCAAELQRYPLLHTLARPDFWPYWAQQVGVGGLESARSFYFPTSAHVFEAAKEGLGIGLGICTFLEKEFAEGTLVAPIAQTVRYPGAYYLNVPLCKLRQSRVSRFRSWILEQAKASAPADAG